MLDKSFVVDTRSLQTGNVVEHSGKIPCHGHSESKLFNKGD